MFIPKKIIETEEKPQVPTSPVIEDLEAVSAQDELKSFLKREDIVTNALPSSENKVLTILIHGYGSSKWLWLDPFFGTFGWLRDYHTDPKPKDLGWHSKQPSSHMYLPFATTISPLANPEGVFQYLMKKGYEVLTYSQIDPFGDIDTSAKEIEVLLKAIKKIYGEKKIVLVGHSRGGICIRKFLDLTPNTDVSKVITLSTPHKGSTLVNFKFPKQPIIEILNDTNLKNFWDVTGSRKAQDINYEQLSNNNEYLKNLNDQEKNPTVEYVVAGGTCPTFAHLYNWTIYKRATPDNYMNIFQKITELANQKISNKEEKMNQWIAYPKRVLTLFDKKLIPEFTQGDGLVSLESALLPNTARRYKIDVNHLEMAICDKTKKLLSKELKLTIRND